MTDKIVVEGWCKVGVVMGVRVFKENFLIFGKGKDIFTTQMKPVSGKKVRITVEQIVE
jgi:hypothetical protein